MEPSHAAANGAQPEAAGTAPAGGDRLTVDSAPEPVDQAQTVAPSPLGRRTPRPPAARRPAAVVEERGEEAAAEQEVAEAETPPPAAAARDVAAPPPTPPAFAAEAARLSDAPATPRPVDEQDWRWDEADGPALTPPRPRDHAEVPPLLTTRPRDQAEESLREPQPRAAGGRGFFAALLGPFRRKAPTPRPAAPAESRALQVREEPAASRPARRALKPLPWGRDFAAAIIRREDTLTAIFGKLDAADSPRVALVAPRGNEELARALGMRRLRRHIDMTGKDVMVVTHSGALRSRAREVGLAVVGNIKKVDFERYGRGGMRVGGVIVPLPGIGLVLRLAIFAGAVAAIAAAVLFYLPQATVQVYPQIQMLANTADITLSTDAPAVYKTGADVPAHRRSQNLSRTVPFPVHGQTTVKAPDGSDKPAAAATDDDIKQATAFAQQVLLREGRKALEDRYKDETLFQDSATLSALDAKPSVKAGEATDVLEITASAQVTMLSADKSTLRAVLEQAQAQKLEKGTNWVPETFGTTVLGAGAFDKTNNRLPVRVKLSEGVTRSFSLAALRKALAGKSRHDAQQAIAERVDQSAAAKIKLEPGWAPNLPRFTSRIAVTVGRPPTPTPTDANGKPLASPTPAATPKP